MINHALFDVRLIDCLLASLFAVSKVWQLPIYLSRKVNGLVGRLLTRVDIKPSTSLTIDHQYVRSGAWNAVGQATGDD